MHDFVMIWKSCWCWYCFDVDMIWKWKISSYWPSIPAIAFSSSKPSSFRLLSVSCFLCMEFTVDGGQQHVKHNSWFFIESDLQKAIYGCVYDFKDFNKHASKEQSSLQFLFFRCWKNCTKKWKSKGFLTTTKLATWETCFLDVWFYKSIHVQCLRSSLSQDGGANLRRHFIVRFQTTLN